MHKRMPQAIDIKLDLVDIIKLQKKNSTPLSSIFHLVIKQINKDQALMYQSKLTLGKAVVEVGPPGTRKHFSGYSFL